MKVLSFWRRLTSKPDFWPLVAVLFFALLASRHLFTPGYFNMHDDLQMMRQFQMEKCFMDGQIPCRWVPDMGYGYGFPLFNFYPPLPYLTGEIFRLIGFSFIDTAKLLFAVAFWGSGITMYFLCKKFFGRIGGIVGSVFYVWAPYHSVDIYVRGAMNEAWALIFFPAILLSSYKLIISKNKRLKSVIFLALSWTGLLLSHNLMAMIFAPVFTLWCLFWLVKERKLQPIINLIISGVLSLGLVAFFTVPVFLEQKLVHADSLVQGYFEYTAHFATTGQILFSRFWGYGPSVWLEADKMSFQIGQIHWILTIVALIVCLYLIVKTRLKDKESNYKIFSIMLFIFIGWFATFMIHSKSTPIWQAIPPLAYVQFPWRFLTLAFSFVVASLVYLIKNPAIKVAILLACFVLVVYNWNYFKPEHGHNGPLTDAEKFSGAAWDLQRTAGIYDYLPLTARENPRDGQNGIAEITEGNAEITEAKQGTNWASFDVDAAGGEGTRTIRINIYEFPEWKVFIDDKEVDEYIPDSEKWGRMYIDVSKGQHSVYAKLYNTPVRTVGNIISAITWVGLIGFVVWKRKKIF